MDFPWTNTARDVLAHYGVDIQQGLSPAKAVEHAKLYGRNGKEIHSISPIQYYWLMVFTELPEDPATPLWKLILEQFKDQLVIILLASAVVSFVLALVEDSSQSGFVGAFVEPLVILLILVANAAVGVIQESSAEKAIDVCNQSLLPEIVIILTLPLFFVRR